MRTSFWFDYVVLMILSVYGVGSTLRILRWYTTIIRLEGGYRLSGIPCDWYGVVIANIFCISCMRCFSKSLDTLKANFYFLVEQSNMGLGWFMCFHWQHDKNSWSHLSCSKKKCSNFAEPIYLCNSLQISCSPSSGWDVSRSYRWWPGLCLDIRLRICERIV